MKETSWQVTFISQSPGIIKAPERVMIKARTCDERNGALIFKSGDSLSIEIIIARGQWMMVEKESVER